MREACTTQTLTAGASARLAPLPARPGLASVLKGLSLCVANEAERLPLCRAFRTVFILC